MDPNPHPMSTLFAQLGLPSAPTEIQAFIARHRPLPSDLPLPEAPFWSPVQAAFLREQLAEDADWAVIIDKLDSGLRQT